MEENFNADEELKRIQEKKEQQKNELLLTEKVNNSISEYYDQSLEGKQDKIKGLTTKLVNAEIEVKEKQIEGRKQVLKSNIEKEVTQAKSEEDAEKHERAKTVLKAQGLVEKLPTPFRITALIIGYPFFVLYLLSLGWMIEFITFVVKGFITMIFDCADKFATLNAKFISNENNKDFKIGKAIFNILKWTLVVGAIVGVVVLLLTK